MRWTSEDQWHVTLRFLGNVDASESSVVSQGLDGVARDFAPVEVRAGPGPEKLGRLVWVLPVSGLEALAGAVTASTAEVGSPPESRPFRGHLTLARAKRPRDLAGLPVERVEGLWTVGEITLVSSTLGRGGARYEVVGAWRLTGANDRDTPDGRELGGPEGR